MLAACEEADNFFAMVDCYIDDLVTPLNDPLVTWNAHHIGALGVVPAVPHTRVCMVSVRKHRAMHIDEDMIDLRILFELLHLLFEPFQLLIHDVALDGTADLGVWRLPILRIQYDHA